MLVAEIIGLNDAILASCEQFEKSLPYDIDAVKNARIHFRKKTDSILSKSNFINHARTWPRGHQGDYQILESAYRNMPSSGGIGYYLDRYCLQTTLCAAVRERKNTLEDLLQAELAARTAPKILDVACGSCRDVFEISADIEKAAAAVTCVDFDSEALEFAADRMSYAKTAAEMVTYRKYNAFKMINHERNLKEFGSQDVIYSVGFFDYHQR
jgi:2-polyprenyl-3-methyl-5-hydroxy-6-metoxy-1,4-benzoquinol methylase